jgi:hypothetical protein
MKTKLRQTVVKMATNFLIAFGLPFIVSNNVYSSAGRLDIGSGIYYDDYSGDRVKIIHKIGALEGYGLYDDDLYFPMFSPSGIKAKIVSILEEETEKKEVGIDRRPENSTSSINLELSLHSQSGDPVTITINSTNELWCNLPIAGPPYFYDFGKKPITLWKRSIIDPNSNPNDPNNYTLSFMADVRESISKNSGVVPLPDLNGTYGSEVPYFYAQVRFNTFPGNFDLHSRVDMQDFAFLAQDWNKTDVNSIADISGPNGIPDKNVDVYDLSLFTRDYLKDPNDPNTW